MDQEAIGEKDRVGPSDMEIYVVRTQQEPSRESTTNSDSIIVEEVDQQPLT